MRTILYVGLAHTPKGRAAGAAVVGTGANRTRTGLNSFGHEQARAKMRAKHARLVAG